MSEKEAMIRGVIAENRRGREIDPEKLVQPLLETIESPTIEERTFEEPELVTGSQRAAIDEMTLQEKEVYFDCLNVMIRSVKRSIGPHMN